MRSRVDEVIRVRTPTTIHTTYNTLHILDVYAIPPQGLEGPPYPLHADTRGLIEIRAQGRPVFKADLRALMDAYWRFAMNMTMSPEDVPDLIQRVRDQLSDLERERGKTVSAEVAKLINQVRVPGQNISLLIPQHSKVEFLRLEETGCMNDSLSPIELQVYTVTVREVQ